MFDWSTIPWYGRVVLLVVAAVVAVYLFQNIILPLIKTIT